MKNTSEFWGRFINTYGKQLIFGENWVIDTGNTSKFGVAGELDTENHEFLVKKCLKSGWLGKKIRKSSGIGRGGGGLNLPRNNKLVGVNRGEMGRQIDSLRAHAGWATLELVDWLTPLEVGDKKSKKE